MSLGALSLSALDTEKKPDNGLYAEINTNRGTMLFYLYFKEVPLTVTNFAALAEGTLFNTFRENEPYFDGLTFYRDSYKYAVFQVILKTTEQAARAIPSQRPNTI